MRWLKRLWRRIFSKRTVTIPDTRKVDVKHSNSVRAMIHKQVSQSELVLLKPVDMKQFTPVLPRTLDQVVDFWTNIMLEMAKWESGLDAAKEYRESFRDSKGNHVISTGLFQISVESLRGYGLFLKQKDLHDPETNIKGALAIIIKLVKDDNRIAGRVNGKWKGPSRYWSVLRGSRDYTAKALAAIKKANK